MNIEWLSVRSGVPPDTIRLFEQTGLLPPDPASSGKHREYGEADLERVQYLREAVALGLSLGEIREILAFRDRGQTPCEHTKRLLEHHVAKLAERIRFLERMRGEFGKLGRQARKLRLSKETACHALEPADRRRDASAAHPSKGEGPDEIRIIELEP